MRAKKVLIGVLFLSLVGAGGFFFTEAYAEDEAANPQPVPEAVRQAVAEYGAGSEPAKIERETKEGLTFYETVFEKDGAELEIKLDVEGRIIEEAKEIPVADLPSAALEALKAAYPGAEIEEVELVTCAYYEIEFKSAGEEASLLVLENGLVLGPDSVHEAEDADEGDDEGEESKVAWDDLPEAVQKGFLSFRGAKPEEVEQVKIGHRVFYEGEYEEENGVEREIKVDGTGMVIEVEEEMDAALLPEGIKAVVRAAHPNAEIEEASLKRSTYYVVELEIDEKEIEVKVLGNGLILGTEEDD